jgi:hypothetical protein
MVGIENITPFPEKMLYLMMKYYGSKEFGYVRIVLIF